MGKKLLGAAMALAIFSAALLLPGWEWVRGKEKGGQPLDGTSLKMCIRDSSFAGHVWRF